MPRRFKISNGLGAVPLLRWIAWLFLVACVGLTVLGLPSSIELRITSGELPEWLHQAPAAAFSCFVLAFAIYRVILIRRGRYLPGRAFLQIGLSVLVMTWLWLLGADPQGRDFRATELRSPLMELEPFLKSEDERVRALACEVISARGKADPSFGEGIRLAKEDPSALVRGACAAIPR